MEKILKPSKFQAIGDSCVNFLDYNPWHGVRMVSRGHEAEINKASLSGNMTF